VEVRRRESFSCMDEKREANEHRGRGELPMQRTITINPEGEWGNRYIRARGGKHKDIKIWGWDIFLQRRTI